MERKAGMRSGWPRGPDKPKGQDKPAPDGPARVVKSGDWGGVPETSMKGFPLAAFSIPGRAQPKPTPAEEKLADAARMARKAEDAHRQALQKAARDAEEASRAAYAKGREDGTREGQGHAWEKYAKTLDELRANARVVFGELSREKAALFLEFESRSVDLASACIRRVFEGLAETHAEAVLPLLRKAVAALGQVSSITIKVHPEDFRTVEENQPFWLSVDAGIADIRVVADDRISRSGCFVDADSTSVAMQVKDLGEGIAEILKQVSEAKARALQEQALKAAKPAEEKA